MIFNASNYPLPENDNRMADVTEARFSFSGRLHSGLCQPYEVLQCKEERNYQSDSPGCSQVHGRNPITAKE